MDPLIGEIKLFSGKYAPEGWEYCEGQPLSIKDNQMLFSILTDTYGSDFKNYFRLPNLKGPTTDAGHENLPVVEVRYIIAIKGMYPIRP